MKVRIGVGLGARTPEQPRRVEQPGSVDAGGLEGEPGFGSLVDRMEALGVDSLWLPDSVGSTLPSPLTGMAFAAGRTERLKLGTGVLVLPGRNPAGVAKELATLAQLAPGRVLPAFGLRHARPGERAHFPLPGPRGEVFDEALVLLRMLLERDEVDHHGRWFAYTGPGVAPRPRQPLDLWLGGAGPRALRRAGRLADGWLGAGLTPAEAGHARESIQAEAAEVGRRVDPEHFGLSLAVSFDEVPPAMLRALRDGRPEVAPEELVPTGWKAARRLVQAHVDVGISKFVIRPTTAPRSWEEFLDGFAAEMAPLQS